MRSGSLPLLAFVALLLTSCRTVPPSAAAAVEDGTGVRHGQAPVPSDLHRAADPAAIVSAARALIEKDADAALVTVDVSGRPRVRTVRVWHADAESVSPAKPLTLWILTRAESRKVQQIRSHPLVTLYFNDDASIEYATLMGRATVLTDPALARLQPLLDDETKQYFWPAFPRDFAVIEVTPEWLEYMSPALPPDRATWRPQAVVFEAR